jgi:hypothetical protein
MSLEVALDALQKDADKWSDTATTLSAAHDGATSITLTIKEFSWAGEHTDLLATYQEAQTKIAELCRQGAAEATGIKDALIATKTTYAGTDEAAKAKLDGVWDYS